LINNLKFVKRTKSNFLFDLQYLLYRALHSAAWDARTIRIAITMPLPTAKLLTTGQIDDAATIFNTVDVIMCCLLSANHVSAGQ